jgi:hypothetical protein
MLEGKKFGGFFRIEHSQTALACGTDFENNRFPSHFDFDRFFHLFTFQNLGVNNWAGFFRRSERKQIPAALACRFLSRKGVLVSD